MPLVDCIQLLSHAWIAYTQKGCFQICTIHSHNVTHSPPWDQVSGMHKCSLVLYSPFMEALKLCTIIYQLLKSQPCPLRRCIPNNFLIGSDRLNLCCCYLSVGVQLWPMEALELAAHLLALFVGQRLCINFFVSSENFLITLRSHFNVTCSFYFWLSLLNVDVNYSCFLNCIEKNLVKYNYFGSCWLLILNFLGDKWVALVLDPHLRRRCTKSKKGLVIGYSKQPWTSMIKVDNYDCSFS